MKSFLLPLSLLHFLQSLTIFFSFSHSLFFFLSQSFFLSLTIFFSFSHDLFFFLSLSLFLLPSLSHSLSLSLSLSFYLFSLSRSLSLSLSSSSSLRERAFSVYLTISSLLCSSLCLSLPTCDICRAEEEKKDIPLFHC